MSIVGLLKQSGRKRKGHFYNDLCVVLNSEQLEGQHVDVDDSGTWTAAHTCSCDRTSPFPG